jgi:type IV secretion system protein TrbI
MTATDNQIDLERPADERAEPQSPAQAQAEAPAAAPPRSPTDIMKDLRLRSALPLVTRLSPKAIIGLTLGTLLIGGAMVTYGLQSRDSGPRKEQINTDNVTRSEAVNVLPADYTKIPLLGAPLPGDFARPLLNGTVGNPPLGSAGGQPQVDPRVQQAAQEREAARTSQLFSGAEAGRQGGAAIADTAPEVPRVLSENSAADGTANATTSPSTASRKQSFLTAAADRRTTSPDRLTLPASTHVLQAGTVIAAALVTGIRSDIPGQVTAQVTQNVYDSVTGQHLLIPQGSKLIGQYDADISFGQSRALLVWNRLILPDGRSIILERLPAADPQGYAGLEDRVNYHWGRVAKAAILSTILGIGAELGNGSSNDIARAIREGTQGTLNQAGQQIVSRQLDVPPTITIRPGTPVRVMVTRDLILDDEGD